MRIVVYGSGGVGGYFGLRLAEAGNQVHFIARGAHLEQIKANGFELISPKGNFLLENALASSQSDQIEFDQIDLVIFACKTFQLEAAAEEIAPFVGSTTLLLPLLNGVESPEILSSVFGSTNVLGGLCRIISKIDRPGRIAHLDVEPSVVFGELDGVRSCRAKMVQSVFSKAGVQIKLSEHIEKEMWTKFMFISSISALGALVRAPIGVLRQGYLRTVIRATLEEIYALAQAKGVVLNSQIIEKQMEIIDRQDNLTTASLQRDMMQGRPSELESQNGAVVRMAKKYGVITPWNEMIYEFLRPQEEDSRN